MARKSFEADTETAVAERPQPEQTVVTQDHWNGGGQVEGEVDAGDIRWPRINVPQKVGLLGEEFAPGSYVFNKEILLSNGTDPLSLTFLKIRKQYQEHLPFDPDGPTPKTFNTAAEVREAGGHFTYGEPGYYRDIAHIAVLVGCPDSATPDQRDYFMYQHDGADYALAMWTVGGGAYTSVAKTLFTEAAGRLRAGLQKGKFNATTEKRSDARNTWYTPLIKSAGNNTPEFQEFAVSLL